MFKKVAKIGILLSIKESWLLFKNTYGLGVHPFKTLRSLSREKDRSQQLLLLGWPIYVLVVGTALVWLGRKTLATSENWGLLAKTTAILVLMATAAVGSYLSYWWIRVWSASRRSQQEGLDA